MKEAVRIGCGQGFWGDDIEAPARLVATGSLDYLVMDFLAEITMSILQKQKARNPESGYARDILPVLRQVAPLVAEHGTKILTNAGGVNAQQCGRDIQALLSEIGLADRLTVAVVTGDDLMPQLEQLRQSETLENIDTGAAFDQVASRVVSANAYIGAAPLVESLKAGADIVICGRSTDTALTLAPLMHEFGWHPDDWDRLAAGIVAGHLIECSAQVTGGNHQADWQSINNLDEVGYPIVEVESSGEFVITKPEGSGGRVSIATVTEQVLYEIGDPRHVLTPDVTVDFTSFTLHDDGTDRVRVSGARGTPPPPTLKASISYRDGYMTSLLWPYAWPDALAKADAATSKIEAKVKSLNLKLDATRADVVGVNAIHGARAATVTYDPPEVVLRYAARSQSRDAIERLSKEMAPMLFGPPGQAGFIAGGRGRVSEIISYWPALIRPGHVHTRVELISRANPNSSSAR